MMKSYSELIRETPFTTTLEAIESQNRERGRQRKAYSWGRSGRMKTFANLYKQNKERRERNTRQEISEKNMARGISNEGTGRTRKVYNWGRCGRVKIFAILYKQNKWRKDRNTKQEIGEKKMTVINVKTTRGTNDDTVNISNPRINISVLDDDIVAYEILSRLPIKSLMRFKSVCKRWRSLIQHDTRFRDVHLTRSRTRLGILIVASIHGIERGVRYEEFEFFLSSNLFEGRAVVQTVRQKTNPMHYLYHESLKLVNGLICFVHCLRNDCVCIYNPSTREKTPWIKTTMEVGKYHEKHPQFEFGFDPVMKEHKVICVWSISNARSKRWYTVCEVLTLGSNSWRKIDEVPPYKLDGVSLCVNGSIYWISKLCHKYHKFDDGDPEVIVAFDVASEKFRAFSIPDFIIDQPQEHDSYRGRFINLLEVDGRLALLCRRNSNTVSLWIFDDVDHDCTNKEKIRTTNTTSSSSSNIRSNWTEVTIALPFNWVGDMYPNFHSIAGTDQIILISCRQLTIEEIDQKILECCSMHTVVSVYSYNRKNNAFEKIEISGISLPIRSPSLFTPMVETLFTPYHELNYVNVLKERLNGETFYPEQRYVNVLKERE